MKNLFKTSCLTLFLVLATKVSFAQNGVTFLQYEGNEGPGNGKHIVLLAADDEYRSEESMPMMAKILSQTYGFKTTVLFAIEPETGNIVPNYPSNIPGLEQLETADLMIMLIRFRELPDEQTQYIADYIQAGKPIIAMRISTHPFAYQKNPSSKFAKYDWQSKVPEWERGFGQQIFGQTWVAHHGIHGKEGTRALMDGVNEDAKHPILMGVEDIWGPSDVYTVRNLPETANVLMWGQSTLGLTEFSQLNWKKSIMPIAWTIPYQVEEGTEGEAFVTTLGASLDFESADLRRLIVNASQYLLGMESSIDHESSVEILGSFSPSPFGFGTFRPGMKVADFK
jgi:hypothetical protein